MSITTIFHVPYRMAYETGHTDYQKQVELEALLQEKKITLDKKSPAYKHHGRFRGPTTTLNSTYVELGYIQDHLTRALVSK